MKKRNIWISLAIIVGVIAVFRFYSRGRGYIKVDTPGFKTTLNLRRGWWHSAVAMSDGRPLKVRAGAYTLMHGELRLEQQGKWWTILCRNRSGGAMSRIRVAGGETTVLKLGPPLEVRPEVLRTGSIVSIGLSLIGQAGEHWIPQVFTAGKRQPTPRLKIVDEEGNILASGKFEYG